MLSSSFLFGNIAYDFTLLKWRHLSLAHNSPYMLNKVKNSLFRSFIKYKHNNRNSQYYINVGNLLTNSLINVHNMISYKQMEHSC